MTISAADTYFGDRLAEDLERRFGQLDDEPLRDILASIFRSGAAAGVVRPTLGALVV